MKKRLIIYCLIVLILLNGCDYREENECWRAYDFGNNNTIIIGGYLSNQTFAVDGDISFTKQLCCTKQNDNSVACIK